jgi:flagellar motor protein MotB
MSGKLSPFQEFLTARPGFVLAVSSLLFLIGLSLSLLSASESLQSAATRGEVISLRDDVKTLTNQLGQLRREYLDKEETLRERERALSESEQTRLTGELNRLRLEQRRVNLKTLAVTLESHLREAGKNRAIEAVMEGDRLIIRLPEPVLFTSGEPTLSRAGQDLLATLRTIWETIPLQDQIIVAVHSDSTPPPQNQRARFPSNWEWTAYRAAVITRALSTQPGIEPTRLNATGKADSEPAPLPARTEIIIAPPLGSDLDN